jgi:hypothetical protein
MSGSTATGPRVKPATRPVHGTFRWAVQPAETHPGCLLITSADAKGKVTRNAYLVYQLRDNGRPVGYRLKKADGTVYDLAADLSSCDCPDGTYHPERPEGGCKHRKALQVALAALGN